MYHMIVPLSPMNSLHVVLCSLFVHFQIGWSFADADDFHSEENKNKMSSGQPLTDQVRYRDYYCK